MQGFPPPPEKRPTLENWDLPPFNRWSFQNIRGLFPTADVPRGSAPVTAFTYDLQEIGSLTFDDSAGVQRSIGDWLLESYTDGFLVCHHGRIIAEEYFNGMQPLTPHLSQSVAKSVIGVLAGTLQREGLLSLEEHVVEYVPELQVSGYSGATIEHLLDMTSGVRFIEDYGAPNSDMTRIDIASGWRPAPPGEPLLTIRDVILTLERERQHGHVFNYRSVETDVLAWVIERVTGQSLAQVLSQRIWSMLGAEANAFFTVDSAGTALADGGFNATLRDYARFGWMMLNGGRVGDRQVVAPEWVEACRTGDRSKFGEPYIHVSPRGAYSRNWWVHDTHRGDFMARGVFGQLIYIDPESDFLVVKLSTWPDYLIENFTLDALSAISSIRKCISEG